MLEHEEQEARYYDLYGDLIDELYQAQMDLDDYNRLAETMADYNGEYDEVMTSLEERIKQLEYEINQLE